MLHVLPADLARGAQVYARALRDALDRDGHVHRLLTLFASDESVLRADYPLGIRSGRLRRYGFDPTAVLRLRRTVRRFRPDVVVAHGGEALKYAALARAGRGALVYYSIGVVLPGAHRFPSRDLYRALVRAADLVACVSKEVVDESHVLLGVPLERLVLVPNGRDPARYHPRPRGDLDPGPPAVGFVGHLTDSKRPELFISLIEELRRRGVALEAFMAGDGPLAGPLAEAARRAGVDMLGVRGDVPELLRRCDLFVFTSRREGEGMPGVLIEAGLSGVPVVATDVPGASTVIEHGRTGLVVGADDFPALVDAAGGLLTDRPRLEAMGAAARERCASQFSLAASAERWDALLAGLRR